MEIILILGWSAVCLVVAAIGAGKKIGFWGAFFVSFFFSPIIGFIVVLVSDAPSVSSGALALYIEAGKERRKGNIPRAIELLNKAININPIYIPSHYRLATYHSLNEEKQPAFHSLSKAVELGFSDFNKIKTDEDLTWLRNQPEYIQFELNNFKVAEGKPRYIQELKELGDLFEKNIITQEEFNTRKARILQ